MRILQAFSLSAGLLSASQAFGDDLIIKRPATDSEIRACPSRGDGTLRYLGADHSNKDHPYEILICSTGIVWQMDCNTAKALKGIFDFSTSSEGSIQAPAQNMSKETKKAIEQCEGLFLSSLLQGLTTLDFPTSNYRNG